MYPCVKVADDEIAELAHLSVPHLPLLDHTHLEPGTLVSVSGKQYMLRLSVYDVPHSQINVLLWADWEWGEGGGGEVFRARLHPESSMGLSSP